uniref:alpha-isopropylmalate synthase regulatory domain-containing protein n=1 Tax=Klebsiella pneumoniae TaxID=573 RepID=UPI0034D45DBD
GHIRMDGEVRAISGIGNGLISGVVAALNDGCGIDLEVVDYHEHALRRGSDAQAAAYVECRLADGRTVFG